MPSPVVVFTSQDDPEISPNFWSRLRVQKKLLSKTEEQTAFCDVWERPGGCQPEKEAMKTTGVF